ncbi:MAG: hypothetical protein AAF495_15440 [Pseudomonadota bacterium]
MGKGANWGDLPQGGLFTVVLAASFDNYYDEFERDEMAGVYYVPADDALGAAQAAADLMRAELLEEGECEIQVKVMSVFAGRQEPIEVEAEEEGSWAYDLETEPGPPDGPTRLC